MKVTEKVNTSRWIYLFSVFEQAIVPWIDAKVDLCPCCGKGFGLGAEIAFPDEDDVYLNSTENNASISRFWPNKISVTRLTNAILDYNPVYRRRHHCRLCGYVLCADCSYFISIHNARGLLHALNGQDLYLFPVPSNASDTNDHPNYLLESEVIFREGNISTSQNGKWFRFDFSYQLTDFPHSKLLVLVRCESFPGRHCFDRFPVLQVQSITKHIYDKFNVWTKWLKVSVQMYFSEMLLLKTSEIQLCCKYFLNLNI